MTPDQNSQNVPAAMPAPKMRRKENGDIDIMHAVGGVRGIAEALLPGMLFLTAFLVTQNLLTSLLVAGAVALVFALVRLAQKGSLVQSLSGLAGLGICAYSALRTGNATEFYLPGLWINLIYGVVLLASVIFRVPALGFIFSLIREEFNSWRQNPARVRAYTVATLVLVAMFAARLLVQVPLYLADNITWLGVARLVMGTPLYAAVLWIAWMVSRPRTVVEAEMRQNGEL